MDELDIKKPIDIIQELIAIYSTRLDAINRLHIEDPRDKIKTQTDIFITELLDELSKYGDAVQTSSGRDNEYQQIWKGVVGKLDTLKNSESIKIFDQLEDSLQQYFKEIKKSIQNLPESLIEILKKQESILSI
jgi:hypothetical protein